MQVISLFSGIGGFELAAEKVGWRNIVSCEINDFGNKVLEYYWPDAYHHRDIHTLDFQTIKEKSNYDKTEASIIVGGFPCQPYSSAGKRKGKEDERHLWPEMLRIIKDVSPDWVVGENVRGIVNWSDGLVFDEVQADLEAAGYEVTAYILPACAVNAPHRRDRVWFVAHRSIKGLQERGQDGRWKDKKKTTTGLDNRAKRHGHKRTSSDANKKRLEVECKYSRFKEKRWKGSNRPAKQLTSYFGKTQESNWGNFPTTKPTVRMRNDGISERLDGITFPKWRRESIKAYGNAVVPQVVEQIFRAINECENGI